MFTRFWALGKRSKWTHGTLFPCCCRLLSVNNARPYLIPPGRKKESFHRWFASSTSVTENDTIFALSTAPGRAGLAVIRISGPRALEALRLMRAKGSVVEDRRANYAVLRHPKTKEAIDQAVVLVFRGPNSFTGEDTVELSVHGSIATVNAVLNVLAILDQMNMEGDGEKHSSSSSSSPISKRRWRIRPATAGEFARRAFDAGKLDLTALEGLSDLLAAQTEAQRKTALRQVGGSLKTLFDRWRKTVIDCMAVIEAVIDFGEDENIGKETFADVETRLTGLEAQLVQFLDDGRRGEIVRRGIRMTIFGAPNAGKSSLLNTLARRRAAIVSAEPGTTRDAIQVTLDIGGFPVIVDDTAGLRTGLDVGAVEREGVSIAQSLIGSADLKVFVLSLSDAVDENGHVKLTPDELKFVDDSTLILLNKIDARPLTPEVQANIWAAMKRNGLHVALFRNVWPVSLTTGEGYDNFITGLAHLVKDRYETGQDGQDDAVITQTRHRYHIEACLTHLRQTLLMLAGGTGDMELALTAQELREAARSLSRVVGDIDVEDVLDALFSTFCIGK